MKIILIWIFLHASVFLFSVLIQRVTRFKQKVSIQQDINQQGKSEKQTISKIEVGHSFKVT